MASCRPFLLPDGVLRASEPGGVLAISRESLRINEEIHIREVRVTSAEGEQLGIMLTRDALRMAEEQHLDLVEVAPNAKPPVCRIMDFGKFRY